MPKITMDVGMLPIIELGAKAMDMGLIAVSKDGVKYKLINPRFIDGRLGFDLEEDKEETKEEVTKESN